MWDSFSDGKRFVLSIVTIVALVTVVMGIALISFFAARHTQENQYKAYNACVVHHLPAECK